MVGAQLSIMMGSIGLMYKIYENKMISLKKIGLALLISTIWINFSGLYNYTDASYMFGTLNLFPLISWTTGLLLTNLIYERYFESKKIIGLTTLYISTIIILEYIGYHILGIQLNSNYPGVFGSDILHVPVFAQIYYLTAGPIFVKIIDKMKIK